MEDLVLREATKADVAAIVALIHAAFEEYRAMLDPPSGAHSETEETIRQRMLSSRVVIALCANEPIGCVFFEQAADHLSFSRLAVPPAYRRRGVGGALIAYVEERALAQNLGQVRLGTRIALPRLRSYYERRGYRLLEYHAHDGYAEPTYVILGKNVHAMSDRERRVACGRS
jgi:N-acetylglutamate synthase-like GNAT family acetyltransferase